MKDIQLFLSNTDLQSNLCTTTTLGTEKERPFFKSSHYSEVDCENLVYILAGLGLGWSY
jgi:hypothetical protein